MLRPEQSGSRTKTGVQTQKSEPEKKNPPKNDTKSETARPFRRPAGNKDIDSTERAGIK
jgi:hypothetical protein